MHREDRKLFNKLMRRHKKQNSVRDEETWMPRIWDLE